MARRYQRDNPVPFIGMSFDVERKRDGEWYMIVHMPLNLAKEVREFHLCDTIPEMWDFFLKWDAEGKPMRLPHGTRTGRRKRFQKRDDIVREAYAQAKGKGISTLMIPNFINCKLKMCHLPPLSDSRIRAIVASKQPP